MEAQLDKELQFHLDQRVADLIQCGHDPAQARRLARIEIGGPEQVKEECRDARGTRWVEDFIQDARYAFRTLRQKPGFAAVAVLTLALGTGASTVMFSVTDGVLLKPLPYPDPDRLVELHGYSANWNVGLFGDQNLSYPDFVDCRRESHALTIAGSLHDFSTMTQPGDPVRVVHMGVSADLFPVLGFRPLRGRAFRPDEDHPGAPPVAILDYRLWQEHFGANPSIVGTDVVLDEKPFTVVGIARPDFRVYDEGEFNVVYTPLGQDTQPFLQRRGPHPIGTFARLQPGATLAQAQAELSAIGHRLAEQYPDTNKARTFIARQLKPDVGDVRSTLWLLLGAVGLVLLIACANIASLLLARAISRERELAMRVALGAGRGRLIRQCLTESGVLALGGGALGVVIAALGIRPFVNFWPGSLPRAQEVQLDWRVLLFALGVSLASGLLFGLAPALRAPSRGMEQTLRAGSRSVTGSSRRLHAIFVVSELALATVLLACAGLLGRNLVRLASLDPGVNLHNVLTARTALSPTTLHDPGRTRAAWQDLLERVRRIPGVQAIAMVDTVPMRQGSNQIAYRTSAAPISENRAPLVLANSVTPDYLKVTGIPLRRGRFLTDQDRLGSESVAVIDEVMAQQAFPGQNPIGKHVWIDLGADPATVVGVVGHVRQWGLAADDQAQVRAQLYYPFAQVPDRLVRRWSELMSIAIRTDVDPLTLAEPLRRAVRGATGDQVLSEIHTLDQLAASSLARQRFLLLLFGVFAGLALLLACIGIYGVLAYLTGQRIPEIGVRMALGATGGEVMWLILRQSLAMVLGGVVIGISGAVAAARLLQSLVQGMRPEISTFPLMVAVLVSAAMFASFVPARRASRIDPVKALRQE